MLRCVCYRAIGPCVAFFHVLAYMQAYVRRDRSVKLGLTASVFTELQRNWPEQWSHVEKIRHCAALRVSPGVCSLAVIVRRPCCSVLSVRRASNYGWWLRRHCCVLARDELTGSRSGSPSQLLCLLLLAQNTKFLGWVFTQSKPLRTLNPSSSKFCELGLRTVTGSTPV